MYDPVICQLCAKEIESQKVLLCSTCKVTIRGEYDAIKAQALKQYRKERMQSFKYSIWIIELDLSTK